MIIPQRFGTSVTSKSMVELPGFGDTSPKAYGAAVYIRVIDSVGQVSSKLVTSKSRVAPIKEVSLPRLELLAAVVNARLLKFVVDTMQIKMHRVVCWTDSMVTFLFIYLFIYLQTSPRTIWQERTHRTIVLITRLQNTLHWIRRQSWCWPEAICGKSSIRNTVDMGS